MLDCVDFRVVDSGFLAQRLTFFGHLHPDGREPQGWFSRQKFGLAAVLIDDTVFQGLYAFLRTGFAAIRKYRAIL